MQNGGIAGLRGTSTSDWATDERPKSFRDAILWRDPNGMTPLTALLSRAKTDAVADPEFSWWEEEMSPARIQIAAAQTALTAATLLTCYATGDYTAYDFAAGDLLMFESATSTGQHWEVVEVSSMPSVSNVLTITRGNTGTVAQAAAAGTWVVKTGSAFPEGAAPADATWRKPIKYSNYTEIFKTTYALSKTAVNTKLRTGDPIATEKKRKAFYHAQQLEHAFLFGNKHEGTGSSTTGAGLSGARTSMPKRFTGGLMYFLRQNYNAASTPTIALLQSTLTQEQFLDATYPMFDYGFSGAGNERIAFCGNGFLNRMNKVVMGDSATRINYDGQIDVFGMKLGKWVLPQGTLYFRSHPLMNANAKFRNAAFFTNPSGIVYRPLKGRDTKSEDNIQPPGADYIAGQWLTETGLEFHHLRSMLYMEITDN